MRLLSPAAAAAAAAIALPQSEDDGTYGLEYRVGHIDHTGETYEGEMLSGVRHGRKFGILSFLMNE